MIRGSKRLWDEYAWSASRRGGENVREGKKKGKKRKRNASRPSRALNEYAAVAACLQAPAR
jgi:hypothetical protein